jgi:hypothetical protein
VRLLRTLDRVYQVCPGILELALHFGKTFVSGENLYQFAGDPLGHAYRVRACLQPSCHKPGKPVVVMGLEVRACTRCGRAI